MAQSNTSPKPHSAAAFQALLQSARDFVIYRLALGPADGRYAVEFVSPNLPDVLGVPVDAPFDTWFEHLHPDDAARVQAASEHAARSGETFHQEMRVFHPGHSGWRWVQAVSNPVSGPGGRPSHFNGLITDISERKAAEAERDASRQQLARSEQLEALGAAADVMANDLNNLLQAIDGRVSLLLDHPALSSAADLNHAVTDLLDQVDRAAAVTGRLLNLSKASAAEAQPLDLGAMLTSLVKLLQVRRPGTALDWQAPEAPVVVSGDAASLGRVLRQLLDFVAEHAGGHRVHVGLCAANPVRVTLHSGGTTLTAEQMRQLFDPAEASGTGLHMHAARSRLDAMGCNLRARQGQNRGLLLDIRLPPGTPAAAAPPATRTAVAPLVTAARPPRDAACAGLEVLLIDDEPSVLEVVGRMLDLGGHRSVPMVNGDLALDWLRDGGSPDLVVMDLVMPGTSGLELYRAIRALGCTAPVVLCSGNPEGPQVRQLLAAGVTHFLHKPFRAKQLLDTVTQVKAATATGT